MPSPEEQEQEQERKLLEVQGMAETFQALAQDQSLPPEEVEMYANLQRSALAVVKLRQKALEHARRATARMAADGANASPASPMAANRTRRWRLRAIHLPAAHGPDIIAAIVDNIVSTRFRLRRETQAMTGVPAPRCS